MQRLKDSSRRDDSSLTEAGDHDLAFCATSPRRCSTWLRCVGGFRRRVDLYDVGILSFLKEVFLLW